MRDTMRKTRGLWSAAVMLGAVLFVLSVAGSGTLATAARPQPPPSTRFVDNGDGTITDNQTGLMWEKKTGTVGGLVVCDTATACPAPTNVNNGYAWTATSPGPDGMLFTDFLAKLNCAISAGGTCPFDGKYRDWRIPTIAELQSIVDTSVATCAAPFTGPCIDPIFGPTAAGFYWSASSLAGDSALAWFMRFDLASTERDGKTAPFYARAVRGGS